MDNKAIARVFEEIADILEIKGEMFFRVNSYRKAALTVSNLAYDLRKVVQRDPKQLEKIAGIGKALSEKIIELVRSGKCQMHEELKKGFPKGLLDLLHLRTVGPKKVKMLYEKLKIDDVAKLKKAAQSGLIRELPGMGEKSEMEILKAIKEYGTFAIKRHLINEALHEAERYIEYLKKSKEIREVQYAGSLRRWQETIGDVDLLVTVRDPKKSHQSVMDHFVKYPEVIEITNQGDTRSSVILQGGMNVDLRVVADESFGAAMHYFTGSKDHNVKMRDIAKKKGLKLNEYGLLKGEKMVAGKTEEGIFAKLGLPYIEPEMRKNDGEIEHGLKHKKMPQLVELKDIKGDLHSHSTYSDGKNSLEEMALAFIGKGYEYFAVTDHSSMIGIAKGMGTKEIKRQWEEIDKLNKKLAGKIRIFRGCEVDIRKDGSLDFSDEILKNLEVVIISAHIFNRLPADEQTKRLIAAIENPYSRILAHPTGRTINQRGEMEFDMDKVIDACVANKVLLEINSNPARLDLVDKYIRIAQDRGAKFVINTDSHSTSNPDFMKFGVGIARRGWLAAKDVVNTLNLAEFDKIF